MCRSSVHICKGGTFSVAFRPGRKDIHAFVVLLLKFRSRRPTLSPEGERDCRWKPTSLRNLHFCRPAAKHKSVNHVRAEAASFHPIVRSLTHQSPEPAPVCVLRPLIDGGGTVKVWMYGKDGRERAQGAETARNGRCGFRRSQRRVILRDVINVGFSSKLLEKQVTP